MKNVISFRLKLVMLLSFFCVAGIQADPQKILDELKEAGVALANIGNNVEKGDFYHRRIDAALEDLENDLSQVQDDIKTKIIASKWVNEWPKIKQALVTIVEKLSQHATAFFNEETKAARKAAQKANEPEDEYTEGLKEKCEPIQNALRALVQQLNPIINEQIAQEIAPLGYRSPKEQRARAAEDAAKSGKPAPKEAKEAKRAARVAGAHARKRAEAKPEKEEPKTEQFFKDELKKALEASANQNYKDSIDAAERVFRNKKKQIAINLIPVVQENVDEAFEYMKALVAFAIEIEDKKEAVPVGNEENRKKAIDALIAAGFSNVIQITKIIVLQEILDHKLAKTHDAAQATFQVRQSIRKFVEEEVDPVDTASSLRKNLRTTFQEKKLPNKTPDILKRLGTYLKYAQQKVKAFKAIPYDEKWAWDSKEYQTYAEQQRESFENALRALYQSGVSIAESLAIIANKALCYEGIYDREVAGDLYQKLNPDPVEDKQGRYLEKYVRVCKEGVGPADVKRAVGGERAEGEPEEEAQIEGEGERAEGEPEEFEPGAEGEEE